MKLLVYLLVLIPIASLTTAPPKRVYIPEEDDPEYKRFIPVQLENGTIEVIDVLAPSPEPIKEVKPTHVFFDLYNSEKTKDGRPYTFNLKTLHEATFRKYFDPSKYTLFVVHGWLNSRSSPVNELIKTAALSNYDVNVIVVDWSSYSKNLLYPVSRFAVPAVGNLVGQLVMKIQDMYKLDGKHFVLIGHSLGAHVVGFAGKTVNQENRPTLGHIIGLDPAGPLFSFRHRSKRLADTDAEVVQVIHTNGALLGFMSAIGTADHYPNGGWKQPNCKSHVTGICSHSRSYEYLAEAIIRGEVFVSRICSDYRTYKKGQCNNNRKGVMGVVVLQDHRDLGDYFLETNSKPPYGRGDVPPSDDIEFEEIAPL